MNSEGFMLLAASTIIAILGFFLKKSFADIDRLRDQMQAFREEQNKRDAEQDGRCLLHGQTINDTFATNARVTELRADIDRRFETLMDGINGRLDMVVKGIDTLNSNIGGLRSEVHDAHRRIDTLDRRV